MLQRRLLERTPSAKTIGVGFVVGRRLAFHKLSKDGSGKCDIETTNSDTDKTYGVLFEITCNEKQKLDRAEGLGHGYKEERLLVKHHSGKEISAIAYVATNIERAIQPYHWYKALVVSGASENELPQSYVEWLRTFLSQADPDTDRREKNERLLFGS